MRILLLRTSALGDIVHCLPVLTALRRHLPEARLGWVVEKSMQPLLDGHPDLDAVIPVGLRPWRRQPFAGETLREVGHFVTALAEFGAEVVLDLMGNHKAGLLGALSLADRRIGLARPHRREASSAVWINHGVEPRGVHAVERALSVLDALGLPREAADFGGEKLFRSVFRSVFRGVGNPPGSLGEGEGNGKEMGEGKGKREEEGFVLIHPGAGWGNKIYPPERWAEAGRLLAREGLAVRVAEGPGEEELAATVAYGSGGAVRTIAAPDLPSLASLLGRARLVLGGDTGPVHLAHALGTGVLAVMGPTDPATHGPYGARERALFEELPCSFCHKRFDGPRACLLAIPPERVAHRALELLATCL